MHACFASGKQWCRLHANRRAHLPLVEVAARKGQLLEADALDPRDGSLNAPIVLAQFSPAFLSAVLHELADLNVGSTITTMYQLNSQAPLGTGKYSYGCGVHIHCMSPLAFVLLNGLHNPLFGVKD